MSNEKIKSFFLKNNFFICLALAISICIVSWFYGCESKVRSLDDPKIFVSRVELEAELTSHLNTVETQLDLYIQRTDSKFLQLDRQDAIKKTVLGFLALYAETGTINPGGIISVIIGLLGTGAIVDNVRVRKNNKKATA